MEGGKNHEPSRFCFEVNAPRRGWKLAVLRLHHGATLQSAVEAVVDLLCPNGVFYQLFGDVNIFSIVLSKKKKLHFLFLEYSLRRMVLPFLL